MEANKKFLADYLLKSPSNGEGHHLVGSSLEVVMDKFNTFAFSNCCNFVSGLKCFVHSGMGMIDSNELLIIIWASCTSMIVDFRGNPKRKYLSLKCQ